MQNVLLKLFSSITFPGNIYLNIVKNMCHQNFSIFSNSLMVVFLVNCPLCRTMISMVTFIDIYMFKIQINNQNQIRKGPESISNMHIYLCLEEVKHEHRPQISRSLLRAVESNYIQNERADLSFQDT